MIAKITNGSDFGRIAGYLHGPGTHTPHLYRDGAGRLRAGGVVIAGTVPVSARRPMGWAGEMARCAKAKGHITSPSWHCSLRAAPGDRRLSDGEWAGIAQQVGEAMGWAGHPWVAVRHDEDHIHLVVCRVGWDGQVWRAGRDRFRVMAAVRAVEAEWELVAVASGQGAPARLTRLSAGEIRKATRTSEVPQRSELAVRVRQARDGASGRGRGFFEAELDRLGVRWQANVASTGRMNGYRFAAPHPDAQGQPVWFTASQLDRHLSWKALSAVLEGPLPALQVFAHLTPRRTLETQRAHARRAYEETAAGWRAGHVQRAADRQLRQWQQQWHAATPVRPDTDQAAGAIAADTARAQRAEHTAAVVAAGLPAWAADQGLLTRWAGNATMVQRADSGLLVLTEAAQAHARAGLDPIEVAGALTPPIPPPRRHRTPRRSPDHGHEHDHGHGR